MNKLQLKKLAADTAYDTAQQNLSFLDAALAAKAAELNLSDDQYKGMQADARSFRAQFVQAYNADLAAAKKAAPAAAQK